MLAPFLRKIEPRLRSRLGREATFSFLSAGVYSLNQWLLLKILFKSMGAETAGWYAYSMALITPITAFASFGLRSVLVTDGKKEFTLSEYFSFRFISCLVTFVCVVAAYFAFAPKELVGFELALGFVCLALYRCVEWISDLAQGEYQRQGRMRTVLAGFLFKLCFGMGGFAVFAMAFRRVTLGFALVALASALILIVYELRPNRLRWRVQLHFDGVRLKQLASLTYPIGIVLSLMALQGSIPRYFLEKHSSLNAVGIFSALTYVAALGGLFATAIGNAASPILSEHWAAGRVASFRRLLAAMFCGDFLVAIVMLALFGLAGELILKLLFSAEVAAYHKYLPLIAIMLLASFWEGHIGCALTVLRLFKTNMVILVLRLLLVGPLTIWLISHWGILGALWASIAFPLCSVALCIPVVALDLRKARIESAKILDADPLESHAASAV